MAIKLKSRLELCLAASAVFLGLAVLLSSLRAESIASVAMERIYNGGELSFDSYFSGLGGCNICGDLMWASGIFALAATWFGKDSGLHLLGIFQRKPELGLAGVLLLWLFDGAMTGMLANMVRSSDLSTILFLLIVTGLALWCWLLVTPLAFKSLRQEALRGSLLEKYGGKAFDWLKQQLDRLECYIVERMSTKLLLGIYGVLALVLLSQRGVPELVLLTLCYVILRQALLHHRRGYDAIFNAVSQMAQGNMDVDIPQGLGTYEPLREATLQIRDGFQTALEQERNSQQMRTELITNVSHDLRTPLTAIITYVDILKNADLPESEKQKCVDVLAMKSARLKSLIDDLFEISKASSNSISVEPEPVDICGFMRQYQLESEDRTADSGLDFRFDIPEGPIIANIDGQLTYRVVENLMSNAIKYSAPDSRVYIKLERSGDYARLEMKNVSKNELNFDPSEITERFIRGDLSRNTEGSGLGLAIAKSFVELQGGIFRVEIDGDLFKAIILLPTGELTGNS